MNTLEDPIFSQVLAADDARYRAMFSGELAALDRLLDDALLYTHSSPVTDTKEQYIDSLRSGRVIYRNARRTDEILRESSGVVLMAGHVLIEATVDGKDRLLDNRFLTVWVQRDHQWKLLAWDPRLRRNRKVCHAARAARSSSLRPPASRRGIVLLSVTRALRAIHSFAIAGTVLAIPFAVRTAFILGVPVSAIAALPAGPAFAAGYPHTPCLGERECCNKNIEIISHVILLSNLCVAGSGHQRRVVRKRSKWGRWLPGLRTLREQHRLRGGVGLAWYPAQCARA